jgi:outer membrane protein, heavy metal efflux system
LGPVSKDSSSLEFFQAAFTRLFRETSETQVVEMVMSSRHLRTFSICLVAAVLFEGAARAEQPGPAMKIDLDQAIQMAIAHNHSLKAARMQIQQSQADETTAALRPNPVLTWDALFFPFFSPSQFNNEYLNNITEFDAAVAYTFERGHKRRARMQAARDQTALTRSLVSDNERTLTFNVAEQFVGVLLAKSALEFAQQNQESFRQTADISEARFKAGAISEGDLLKIKLQLLQFQTDESAAKLQLVQALASLRQLLGYDAVPANYDVVGDLAYTPLQGNKEDLQLMALKQRPDFLAAQTGVTAAQSQFQLAKANGKRDLTASAGYTRVGAANNASFIFNIEIPLFDRNQGEIARSRFAVTQADEEKKAAEEAVMTDVSTAYETVQTGKKVIDLYESGYLKQSRDSRDISEYAYKRGAASLLDYLDAERSYRSTELAYRQALAAYMLAMEQLRGAVGTRNLP